MLIPVIALGVPLIDTIIAPVRRFLLGRAMFQPDRLHLHHQLVRLGYTHRRAVLIIYGCTICMGVLAIIFVHAQNETAALLLFVIGIAVIFIIRYLGVTDFLTLRRMTGWARDLSDEAGISHGRRAFLNHQLEISRACTLEELWQAVTASLEDLEFDCAEFSCSYKEIAGKNQEERKNFTWRKRDDCSPETLTSACTLKIEMPLNHSKNSSCHNFGTLLLIKNMEREAASHYTLKRVEHLRRSMVSTLIKICGPVSTSRPTPATLPGRTE
jgi:UDP-GlcNAc:undecaprenyl-phosphate GlcNAc-1-phosphate transferase